MAEGLDLAQVYGDVCTADDWNDFNRLSGFVHLSNFDFDSADASFAQCHLDPRALLSFWPDLMPPYAKNSGGSFDPVSEAFSTLHSVVAGGNADKEAEVKAFVLRYAGGRLRDDPSPPPVSGKSL